jgi:YVTN family beta-propeller protein
VTLAAVAATGSVFAGWSGGGCTGTGVCTMTVSAATAVTATFDVAPPYAQTVVHDAPIGYWRLGEKSGTSAADRAGTNTGTYSGGVTLGVPGLLSGDPDTAASFNGANQMVTVPSTTALSPSTKVTLEAWIKPAALPAAGAFASVVTKAESYSLQFNGPRMEFTIMQNGTRRRLQAPSGAIVVGSVYHVVGTYDGATQRLYVNGAQVASAALTGAITTNTTSVRIASWAGGQEFFKGVIDEVAIFPSVLTAAGVLAHYNAGIAKTSAATTSAPATLVSGSDTMAVGGTAPVAAAFDPALHRLYVSRNDGATNGVAVIDTDAGAVVAQITTGRWAPGALAVDTSRHLVYVTAAAYGAIDDRSGIEVIDGRTNRVVQSIATPPGPKAVAVNARTNRIYVTSASGTDGGLAVSVVDGASGVTIATIPVGTYARYYDEPFGLAVDTVANRVYATSPLDGTLHVIDGATNAEVRSIGLGGAPNALAVDEQTHVVAVAYSVDGGPAVGFVDGPTGALAGRLALASDARGLAVDAAHDTLYVATRGGNVATIAMGRRHVVRVTPTGTDAYGIALDSVSGTRAVVDDVDAVVSLEHGHSAGFS